MKSIQYYIYFLPLPKNSLILQKEGRVKKGEKNSALVGLGCHNKIPQTREQKTAERYLLTGVEAGSWGWECQSGWVLVRALFLVCRWQERK